MAKIFNSVDNKQIGLHVFAREIEYSMSKRVSIAMDLITATLANETTTIRVNGLQHEPNLSVFFPTTHSCARNDFVMHIVCFLSSSNLRRYAQVMDREGMGAGMRKGPPDALPLT